MRYKNTAALLSLLYLLSYFESCIWSPNHYCRPIIYQGLFSAFFFSPEGSQFFQVGQFQGELIKPCLQPEGSVTCCGDCSKLLLDASGMKSFSLFYEGKMLKMFNICSFFYHFLKKHENNFIRKINRCLSYNLLITRFSTIM